MNNQYWNIIYKYAYIYIKLFIVCRYFRTELMLNFECYCEILMKNDYYNVVKMFYRRRHSMKIHYIPEIWFIVTNNIYFGQIPSITSHKIAPNFVCHQNDVKFLCTADIKRYNVWATRSSSVALRIAWYPEQCFPRLFSKHRRFWQL